MPQGPILLVDDEPVNLASLRQILSSEYRLVFATSGSEALEAAQKHRPALVLLDIQMPGLSGYDVCRALRSNSTTKDIPVLFVTGFSDVGKEVEGFEAGAVDYIVRPLSPVVVKARVRTHLSLVRASLLESSYRDAISMLGTAGHFNDSDTGVHIWRMAAYARAIAEKIGWSASEVRLIEQAAAMHDTGKIGIPDAILKKPARLTADEWVIMKTHTTIGYGILSRSKAPVFQMAADIALRHHEKWDGSGYPDGLCGEQIPESARIVALADVFDALTMKRPYKDPWPLDRVLATIHEGSGAHFDPDWSTPSPAYCLRFSRREPTGTAKRAPSDKQQVLYRSDGLRPAFGPLWCLEPPAHRARIGLSHSGPPHGLGRRVGRLSAAHEVPDHGDGPSCSGGGEPAVIHLAVQDPAHTKGPSQRPLPDTKTWALERTPRHRSEKIRAPCKFWTRTLVPAQ